MEFYLNPTSPGLVPTPEHRTATWLPSSCTPSSSSPCSEASGKGVLVSPSSASSAFQQGLSMWRREDILPSCAYPAPSPHSCDQALSRSWPVSRLCSYAQAADVVQVHQLHMVGPSSPRFSAAGVESLCILTTRWHQILMTSQRRVHKGSCGESATGVRRSRSRGKSLAAHA